MNPSPRFLGDLLQVTAERLPNKRAIVYKDQRQTWGEFNQRVDNLARAFLSLGVQRGDRIGVICTTRPEYLCTYLAAARVGAILAGFNVQYTRPELLRSMALLQPRVMVVLEGVGDRQLAVPFQPLSDQVGFVEASVVIGDRPAGSLSWGELASAPHLHMEAALASRRAELQEDDGVLAVFTSGSTGEPKATVLTHRNVLDNILVQRRQFGFREDDRVLQAKPMSHVGGATNLTLPSVAVGAMLVFMDHFHPAHALDTIQRERISILGQVPTMFIMEFNLPGFKDYDLSSLRTLLVAGAPTPYSVMHQMAEVAQVITGYGMTEVGGYVTYTSLEDDLDTIATTVGAVAVEFELHVVDDARQPLPVGATGEVAIRGSCVFKEYFRDPEATRQAKDERGWFYTGDTGYLDERGYLTLVGRKKEMYISGGYNVHPREVEQHISLHPKVAFAAVIGVPDPVMGEVGLAIIAPAPGTKISIEEVEDHCKQGLARYKIPRRVVVKESLPLTSSGKIDRQQLIRELNDYGNLRD